MNNKEFKTLLNQLSTDVSLIKDNYRDSLLPINNMSDPEAIQDALIKVLNTENDDIIRILDTKSDSCGSTLLKEITNVVGGLSAVEYHDDDDDSLPERSHLHIENLKDSGITMLQKISILAFPKVTEKILLTQLDNFVSDVLHAPIDSGDQSPFIDDVVEKITFIINVIRFFLDQPIYHTGMTDTYFNSVNVIISEAIETLS